MVVVRKKFSSVIRTFKGAIPKPALLHRFREWPRFDLVFSLASQTADRGGRRRYAGLQLRLHPQSSDVPAIASLGFVVIEAHPSGLDPDQKFNAASVVLASKALGVFWRAP